MVVTLRILSLGVAKIGAQGVNTQVDLIGVYLTEVGEDDSVAPRGGGLA